jgi:hypothetical protein
MLPQVLPLFHALPGLELPKIIPKDKKIPHLVFSQKTEADDDGQSCSNVFFHFSIDFGAEC